jgi:hypothetical protein
VLPLFDSDDDVVLISPSKKQKLEDNQEKSENTVWRWLWNNEGYHKGKLHHVLKKSKSHFLHVVTYFQLWILMQDISTIHSQDVSNLIIQYFEICHKADFKIILRCDLNVL